MCLLAPAAAGGADEFRLDSVGARAGLSQNWGNREFYQAEAFSNWRLPWSLDPGKQWWVNTRLDFSLGWLSDHGQDAAVGTAGPTFVLARKPLPVSFEIGVSPTFISRHKFPEKDLGTDFQLTSHAGLNWDFSKHWSLTYRFQHMSNCGLASPNPGVNMHLLGLSYRF